MPAIGDVFVTLRIEGSAFERGVAAAQQQTERLRQTVTRVPAAAADMGGNLVVAGKSAESAGHGFNFGGQQMARFAAIAVEQVVPAAQGSRVVMEGAFLGASKLAGGYGTLAIAAVGVAGIVGFGLVKAFGQAKSTVLDAEGNIRSLDERFKELGKSINKSTDAAAAFNAMGKASPGVLGSRDIEGARKGMEADKARLKLEEEQVKMARQMEGFSEAGGLSEFLAKNAENAAKAYEGLRLSVEAYQRSAAAAMAADPMQLMLIAERAAADALIRDLEKIVELGGAAGEIAQRRMADIEAAFAAKTNAQLDQASKAAGPGVAGRLGLGGSNLITGFGDVEQLKKDIGGFASEMKRLAEAGIPARDLFPQIAEGQTKVNEAIAKMKEKYADVPPIFNMLLDLEKQYGNLDLQRTLDEQTRSLQGVKQGTVTLIDTADGIESRWVPALKNSGIAISSIATAIDNGVIPAVADWSLALEAFNIQAFTTEVVILTGDVYALARAFRAAQIEALALAGARAGAGTTSNVPAPGNF